MGMVPVKLLVYTLLLTRSLLWLLNKEKRREIALQIYHGCEQGKLCRKSPNQTEVGKSQLINFSTCAGDTFLAAEAI